MFAERVSGLTREVFDALPAHVAVLDGRGVIRLTNLTWNRFAAANGYAGDGYGLGLSYLEICDRAQGEGAEDAMPIAAGLRALLAGEREQLRHAYYPCHAPGQQRWFSLEARRSGEGAVVMHLDVSAVCVEAQLARQNLLEDPLTGLVAPALFEDRLAAALADAAARGRKVGLLLLEVAGLAAVNRTHGWQAGDAVLRAVADRTSGRLRGTDTSTRLGGSEFGVALTNLRTTGALDRVQHELEALCQAPVGIGRGKLLSPRLAFGAAIFPDQAASAGELLRVARRRRYLGCGAAAVAMHQLPTAG